MTPIEAVIAYVLDLEGAVKDVGDGKGVTRWGQTPAWLAEWQLSTPASREQAAENYRTWLTRTGLEAVCVVDDVLARGVVTWAVHSGHGRPTRVLQVLLGEKADGVIGPKTRAALTELPTAHRTELAAVLVASYTRLLMRLMAQPQNAPWGGGWGNRVGGLIEQLA